MTWEQLQTKQAQLRNELQAFEKYTKQMETLQLQIAQTEMAMTRYEQQLQQAQKTYDKLETHSILNLLRDFTGKRDELLKDNVEQIAQIEAKLAEAILMHQDLQYDVAHNVEKIAAIDHVSISEQLKEVRAKMEVWLMAHAPHISEQLTQIIEEQLLSKRLLIEIDEAIEAGLHAEDCLRAAAEKIREADGYSTWDLVGGGFIATALKHSSLDESNSAVHTAQIALQRFKNELLDIQEIRHEDMYVTIDGVVQFADYIFDDIFSDWMVHSKISAAKGQIVKALDDVVGTIYDLRMKIGVVEEKQLQLQQQKEAIFSQSIERL